MSDSADSQGENPGSFDGGTRWPAVLAALFCGIAVAFNIGKVPIALGQIREEFDLSLVTAGWVASTFNTLAVFSAVFFGMLCDRVGQLRMAVFGLGLSFVAGVGAMLAGDGSGLLVSRVFEGVGFLSVAVSAPGLISAAAQPADRRFALGLWASFMPTGVGLAMVLGPFVMPIDGWRTLWGVALLGFVLATLGIARNRRAYGAPHGVVADNGLALAKEVLRTPAPWLMALSLATWAIQYFALVVWLPTFLREQRHLAPAAVGVLTALIVIVNAPGTILGGSLIQRHFRRGHLVMVTSVVTTLLSFAIYRDGLPDLVRYFACLVLSFVGGLIPAAVLSSSLVLAKSPRQIGTLQGLFMQGGNLGQFVGPPLIAALVAATGQWHDALYVAGGAALCGIVLGYLFHRIESRQVS